ncbi:MAG TPA: HlyD family efflux transporter periplasmic adaptor subunit [Verrucomicrobiae bacterium]|nr:HlyD family efflux transporter periplasmic adaptor subunit [Verrucomicrobiae bacterium]
MQGYVEGEFVHVASPLGGRLEKLEVARGQTVAVDAPLFDLEADVETAALKEAEEAVRAAEAHLADLGTGRRKVEQDVTRAQLDQAIASEKQSAASLERDQAQFDVGGISRAALDETQARHDVDAARVRQLQGEVEVARLPARSEQIRAQSAEVEAARAGLVEARWRLDQKQMKAPVPGLVFDTLFRVGEWVPAGAPVVRMLPPANIKVRFFVPEPLTARYPLGQAIEVRCDGCAAPIAASVTYASAEAEYTPPVIYSNENRSKLVFLYEARPDAAAAASLRPGQPVEVAPR